jgi:DNA-binding GntR family transcriptional regulator
MTDTRVATGATDRKAYPRAEVSRQPPLYERIGTTLRQALDHKTLPIGAVLLEGSLADIFGSTRMPVRQALQTLEAEGGISRFSGRGYVVGPPGTAPLRIALQPSMFSLAGRPIVARKKSGWELIYEDLERDLVHLSIFGRYRINELEIARHFKMSRAVIRDALLRMESLGLLTKDERMRWVTRPLDASRIKDLYELRQLLEPAALQQALKKIDRATLRASVESLQTALSKYPAVSRTAMDDLEQDLHVRLLGMCSNQELIAGLERCRCILTLSKHVLGHSAPMPAYDPFISEHLEIFEAAGRGAPKQAARFLTEHLAHSCGKVIERAEVVRTCFELPSLPYLG